MTTDSEPRSAALRRIALPILAEAELKIRGSHLDPVIVLGIAGTLALFSGTLVLGRWLCLDPSQPDLRVPELVFRLALAFAFGGTAFTIWGIATAVARHYRRAVLPRLALELKPASPTQREIEDLLAALRRENVPGAQRLKNRALWRAVSRYRPAPPWKSEGTLTDL